MDSEDFEDITNVDSELTECFSSFKADNIDKNAILHSLILKCRNEMHSKKLEKPLEDYVARVAFYTGLTKENINSIISDTLGDIQLENKYFDLDHRIQLFKCLASMYDKKQNPKYENVFIMLKNLNVDINYYQMQYMMSCLGFEYRKTQKGSEFLVEDPELTFERYHYLKEIIHLKSIDAPIYYIDERFFDSSYSFPKPWIKNIDVSKTDCDGYVFFHAVSKKGFLNGLFCSPTNEKDFLKWVAHYLIPLMKQPSIIVLDRNDLHISKTNSITKYHSKQEMLYYLQQNNIPCNEKLHKAELYKLISEYSTKRASYDIEEICKSHGHMILWMPTSFHDLSLTHFLWKHVEEQDFFKNTQQHNVKNILLEKLINLPSKLLETFSENLVKQELIMFNVDQVTYKALEKQQIL